MSVPISATTTPAPDYPASFFFTNAAYRFGDDLTIGARLPDAYIAHLARTQARKQVDVADMSDGDIVDRLIRDYKLESTTAPMTITHVVGNRILSRWHSYISLGGTAPITFTDDDGQDHTMTIDCEILLDLTKLADTTHHCGYGQSLGLRPEQIQEITNMINPRIVVTYLNAQFEQAPLVVTDDLTWEIVEIF